MGYNPVPDEQWTPDDLARAEAAKDLTAINKARRAGHLYDILNPPAPELSDAGRLAEVLTPPAGPTVPGQQPGGNMGGGAPAPMTQADLDNLAAAGDLKAINAARREGRLIGLGVAPSKNL